MLKYIIIALVFWFNPLVSNVDILPDIVGYLLIIKAFSKASYVYTCASELCTSAKKMCIISGVKIFSVFMISSFDITMSLLLSFSFALFELVFGVPFIIKLFETVMYLASLENHYAHANATKIKRLTIGAFAARLILAVLPDLTALSLNDALTIDTDITYLRFRPIFIVFSVLISLIISSVWLIRAIRYFKKSVDSEVFEKCNGEFSRKMTVNSSLLFAKKNMRAITLAIVGALFVFDFTWEYTSVDIFQDFMFPLLAFVAVCYLLMTKACRMNKLFFVLGGALALQLCADILEMVANISYFEKYNMQSMLKVSEAEDMYTLVTLSAVFASITAVSSCIVVLCLFRSNARQSILAHKSLFSEIDIDFYLKEFDRKTKKSLIITSTMSVAMGVVYSLSVALKPYADWIIMLNMIFEVLFIIFFISAALYIHDEVYKRILTFA